MGFPLRILCILRFLLFKALEEVIASQNVSFEIAKIQSGIHL